MRPVVKCASAQDDYPNYRDALDDLADRIGLFCSYCEQPIRHAPEIEHVQPKSLKPELECKWKNLLIACTSCNRTKRTKSVGLAQVAMPDTDSTFRGLEFFEGGRIGLFPDLTDAQTQLMRHVVRLVRLDRHPDAKDKGDQPRDRDKRADLRRDVWDTASRCLGHYEEQREKNPWIRNLIADEIVPPRGFFSVWMTVFRDPPDMLKRFNQAIPGTDSGFFDDEGQAVPRPGGRL